MTEQELDLLMRNVLLDAIAMDEETQIETIPYTPSLHHQKQIKAMLKSPLRWARDRKQPVWKRALKRVAVILLVISLAFGSLMVVSPTARATFIRWVTEWYETHVTYRYAGDDMVGDLPEYTITELPEGYAEDRDQRIEFGTQTFISYQNGDIDSASKAKKVLEYTGADAILIGRAALGNPWLFQAVEALVEHDSIIQTPSLREKCGHILHHIQELHQFYGEQKGYRIARKHVAWYLQGIQPDSVFRQTFNAINEPKEQLIVLEDFLNSILDKEKC